MTQGSDFSIKEVKIPDTNTVVELYLFDTGGHKVYESLNSTYWKGASMLMLVFNMTDENSFNNCEKWLKKYKEAVSPMQVEGVLVGTKVDLKEENAVMLDEHKPVDFANKHKLRYFETSAKEKQGVEDPFHFIANVFYNSYEEEIKQIITNGI
eukprot:CAMPEP_0197521442 /NCGR_PEP_ID=MMETSP1318-20131121/6718_1 /TAXON_ID=552666 /ORGANISM="Partenskyella glossopodia, Strain RCC365" /LENGTH=152 /DNA_ID=CAMNT_0043073441 /DNA_START=154 /DNA_END=612 /DNA_ORIENTATION=+